MKKQIITMVLLLIGMTSVWAQENQAKIDGNPNVNTIVVNTTGDVTIYQGDKFAVKWDDEMVRYNMNFEMKDSVVYLSGEIRMMASSLTSFNSADIIACF